MLIKYFFSTIVILSLILPYKCLKGQSGSDKPSLLIGFYGGVNFSKPIVLQSFQLIESMNGQNSDFEKQYKGYLSNMGNQFGFVIFYPFKNLHIGFMPAFSTYSFKYGNKDTWVDAATPGAILEQRYDQEQKLRYFELPLVVRYYFGISALKPYIQGQGSYGLLHSADNLVQTELIQNQNSIKNSNSASSNSAFIRSKICLGAGVGISYDLDQLIITLDISMLQGMNNIANEKNRYSNPYFTGANYDVQDNLKLNNIPVNLSIIFPINKITRRGKVSCTYFKTKK